MAIESFVGSFHGAIDGVASSVASVGVRLGCKGGKVVLGGVQAALHSANTGGWNNTEMSNDVRDGIIGSALLQGALVGFDALTGNLSTSSLQSQLRNGTLRYGGKQMIMTGGVRVGSNLWRKRSQLIDKFLGSKIDG